MQAADRTPSPVSWLPGLRQFCRGWDGWDKWLQPWAPSPPGLLPSPGVGRPIGTGTADLRTPARVSSGKPHPSPGTGPLARTDGEGDICSPCPASRRFPPGAPARPLWALDPRAGAAPAAPRVGPALPASQANPPAGRAGGFGETWDRHLRDRAAPLSPPCHPRRRGGRGRGLAPRPIKGCAAQGVRHRKGRERARKGTGGSSRERSCTRGGRAVPTCAPGRAPAARRADQSPVWRTHRQPSSFPPDLPKTSFAAAAKPSRAKLRRAAPALPAPRESPLPAGESLPAAPRAVPE